MAKTYDASGVSVSFNTYNLTGFAEGTFITVSKNEDAFTQQIGADGEGVRSKTNNRSGTITLTLMQSSDSNETLSQIYYLDKLSNTGSGAFFIKDTNGTTLVLAKSAWIRKMPDIEFGKESSNREWVFESDSLEMFAGKNS